MMLNDKTALVTGASRGLGRAIAIEIAKSGAKVALLARSEAGLRATERAIADEGGTARGWPTDLNHHDAVQRAVAEISDWAGGLDILINNAGIIEPLAPFVDAPLDAWLDNLTINVGGTVRITHAVLPLLLQRRGTIVTISSGAAVSNISGWSAYCTAKTALDRFAMVLDLEVKDRGVRSFSFAPGTIETHMQQSIRSTGVGPARLVHGEVEHLPPEVPARAVTFLCTPQAAELAGQHIDIRYPEVRKVLGLEPLE